MSSAVMPRPPRTVRSNVTDGIAACNARIICQGNAPPSAALFNPAALTEPTVVADPTASTFTTPPAVTAWLNWASDSSAVTNSSGAPQVPVNSVAASDGCKDAKTQQSRIAEANRRIQLSGISPRDRRQGDGLPLRGCSGLAAIPGGDSSHCYHCECTAQIDCNLHCNTFLCFQCK